MANQTILFTVLPRSLSLNPAPIPISVFVAPRLQGADRLAQFPDWLDWTGQLKDRGLKLTLRCATQTLTVDVDPTPLRPDLWRAMFNEQTFVRSHAFNDYADRAIFSYPARVALSVIKSTYQEASVALALPERNPPSDDDDQRHSPSRQILKGLLSGLAVNWNDREGERLRDVHRKKFKGLSSFRAAARYEADWLAADGTLKSVPPIAGGDAAGFRRQLAQQFAVYSHMPQGAPVHANPPDFAKLIDFHQALSSLGSFPELLRALGLVLDFELPAKFVALTAANSTGRLAVVDLPGRQWSIPTQSPPNAAPLETAYLHFATGDSSNPFRLFATAPGVLGGGLQELDVFGLLNLEPVRYGIAQVDLESGMHKATRLAESWQDGRDGPSLPDHPEVFDETTTLPSLRSGGFSLYADARALRLSRTFSSQKGLNASVEQATPAPRPLFAEDLTHGYRVDVWDSFTGQWNSLHRRRAVYDIGGLTFKPDDETEGFTELAAAQAAPDPANPPPNDLYLNESIARWNGWSLSVPFPGKVMTDDPDPAKALVEDPTRPPNQAATPFKMSTQFSVVAQSLPALRFGRRYRFRLRAVDIAGNSMKFNDPLAALLSYLSGLPRDPDGFPYLRYEPVVAPTVVLRDARSITDPGSQLQRLVIRTFNDDPLRDGDAADTTAADRFIVPPSTSVEVGERLGMFDTNGKLDTSTAMYKLIGERDQGTIDEVDIDVAGKKQKFPLVDADSLDALPYLPDVLARGAALRDLPGSAAESLGTAVPGAGAAAPVDYQELTDANPRLGSATLVSFGGDGDWQKLLPFRLTLVDGSAPPEWNPQQRVLAVSLPKGTQAVVPLSSYLHADDLKLMGVWQWLREHIEKVTGENPGVPVADAQLDSEKIAHLLQRAHEGGHWMLTPPKLLTLVHAVKQPLGSPQFTRLYVQHEPYGTKDKWGTVNELAAPDPTVLQTAPESRPTAPSELGTISAWRRPGSPEAHLLGGLEIHAASTDKIELLAEWRDPFDDVSAPRDKARNDNGEYYRRTIAEADEIPVPSTREGLITVGRGTPAFRRVAYYDADHDLLCFVRGGDRLGNLASGVTIYGDAAPRHHFDDTRYHKVTYTARATSRYREYFTANAGLSEDEQSREFTRTSEPVVVEVPASARPAAPHISYVVPTFGWQRQTQSNLKRSVRFGGGLRVYLDRPWFSSGDGELLGVTFYDYSNGSLVDREAWKPYVTQWGRDPIWNAADLGQLPFGFHFPNKVADEPSLSLPGRAPGRVGVAGFAVDFDYDLQKWFADLTIDVQSHAYTPFVRLVLVRYQPFALPDSKLSPAVVADYIQLTPERSAVVTVDPYHPRVLRLTVSGPAPTGPAPEIVGSRLTNAVNVPTLVTVTVQRRDPSIATDLGWVDAPALATVTVEPSTDPSGLVRWTGAIRFVQTPQPGNCRLVIREHEYLSANHTIDTVGRRGRTVREQPKRLIYAETVDIDVALIGGPTTTTGTTLNG